MHTQFYDEHKRSLYEEATEDDVSQVDDALLGVGAGERRVGDTGDMWATYDKKDYGACGCKKRVRCCCCKMLRWQLAGVLSVVLAALATVVACVLVFVVVPKVAQLVIDDSSITLESVRMYAPDPAAHELATHISGLLYTGSFLSAKTSPAVISIAFDKKKFGETQLPALDVRAGEPTAFSSSSVLKITDQTVFNSMSRELLLRKLVRWEMSGSIDFKAIGVTVHSLHLDKVVTVPGMNALGDAHVTRFSFGRSNATSINCDGTIVLRNPSIITLDDTGVLTFAVVYENVTVGEVHTLGSTNLTSGDNTIYVEGTLHPAQSALPAASRLMSRHFAGEPTPIASRVVKCSQPLFAPALIGFELATTLDGANNALVNTTTLNSLSMSPIDNEPTRVTLRQTLELAVRNPLGAHVPLDIRELSMTATLSLPQTISPTHLPAVVGTFSTPRVVPRTVPASICCIVQVDLTVDMQLATDAHGNTSAFDAFIDAFVNQPFVRLRLQGTTNVLTNTSIGLVSLDNLPVDTLIDLVGLNGLPVVEVDNINLPHANPDGPGLRMECDVKLYNPSQVTFSMAELATEIRYDNTSVGFVNATSVRMMPGWNLQHFVGYMSPLDLDAAGRFFSKYLSGQPSQMQAHGISAGSNEPAWLQAAARALHLNANVTALHLKSFLSNVFEPLVELQVAEAPYMSNATIEATVQRPPGVDFAFSVLETSLNLTSYYDDSPAFLIQVPTLPVDYNASTESVRCSWSMVELQVVDLAAAQSMIGRIITEPSAASLMVATAAMTINIPSIGNLSLTDLPIRNTAIYDGLDSFSAFPIRLTDAEITHATPTTLLSTFNAAIPNPTNTSMSAGDLVLNVRHQGQVIGNTTIHDAHLPSRGVLHASAGAVLFAGSPAEQEALRHFLGNYLEGKNSSIELVGVPAESPTLLKKAGEWLVSPTSVPGGAGNLITYTQLSLVASTVSVDVKITFENPFAIDFVLETMSVDIYPSQEPTKLIGTVDAVLNPPLTVGPKQRKSTPKVVLNVKGLTLGELRVFAGQQIFVNVNGTMASRSGGAFNFNLAYSQNNVPASFLSQ